jgi:glycosyltransferase involved in cell wall biosynthesis
MKVNVILRTHDGKNVHGGERFIKESKVEIIKRCVKSLIVSLDSIVEKSNISLIVVDDHSTKETVEWIEKSLGDREYQTSFIQLEESGNGSSMRKCYELGLQSNGDLIYFVEDDYFHRVEAISVMLKDYENFSKKLNGSSITIVPYDDPLDYKPDRIIPTRIVPGVDRHWRQNFHTTFTMMIPKWILLHYWDKFMEMTKYGIDGRCEDNTINLMYTKFDVFLFSPMPGLAIHMCDIPPVTSEWIFDWEKDDENRSLHNS